MLEMGRIKELKGVAVCSLTKAEAWLLMQGSCPQVAFYFTKYNPHANLEIGFN